MFVYMCLVLVVFVNVLVSQDEVFQWLVEVFKELQEVVQELAGDFVKVYLFVLFKLLIGDFEIVQFLCVWFSFDQISKLWGWFGCYLVKQMVEIVKKCKKLFIEDIWYEFWV